MSAWMEAYARWPASNQLAFSLAALLLAAGVVVLAGVWMLKVAHCLAVLLRGWPPVSSPSVSRGAELSGAINGLLRRIESRPEAGAVGGEEV